MEPSYIQLYRNDELRVRAARLKSRLAECDICPRACGADRLNDEYGFCRSGSLAVISACCDHHGEEPVLSGTRGSGTIFFSGCTMRCQFCQNYQISQEFHHTNIEKLDAGQLAEKMLYLQDELKCHNINLVSPTHFTPQIVEAVDYAASMGLHIPLVYNTNGYDSVDTLKELDGVIDIYLPDIKYASDRNAVTYSQVDHYVDHARQAILEMYRQVGNLLIDEHGTALRGLIVRHLVLPNDLSGTKENILWLLREVSPDIVVSIMSQYHPSYNARFIPELSRKLTKKEYQDIAEWIEEAGPDNGWMQEYDSSDLYLPDFNIKGHPFEKM